MLASYVVPTLTPEATGGDQGSVCQKRKAAWSAWRRPLTLIRLGVRVHVERCTETQLHACTSTHTFAYKEAFAGAGAVGICIQNARSQCSDRQLGDRPGHWRALKCMKTHCPSQISWAKGTENDGWGQDSETWRSNKPQTTPQLKRLHILNIQNCFY